MSDNQRLADELLPDSVPAYFRGPAVRAIAAALDAAEERGRASVGLGDFLPDPCGDEYSDYPWYIAESYGDWVSCSRRKGHEGQHEHEDSGMKWGAE